MEVDVGIGEGVKVGCVGLGVAEFWGASVGEGWEGVVSVGIGWGEVVSVGKDGFSSFGLLVKVIVGSIRAIAVGFGA